MLSTTGVGGSPASQGGRFARLLEGVVIALATTAVVWVLTSITKFLKGSPHAPLSYAFIAAILGVMLTSLVWASRLRNERRYLTTSDDLLHLPLPPRGFDRQRIAAIHFAAHGLFTACGERVTSGDAPTRWLKRRSPGPVPAGWERAVVYGPYTAFPHLIAKIDRPEAPDTARRFRAWFRIKAEGVDDGDFRLGLNVMGNSSIPHAPPGANNYDDIRTVGLSKRDFPDPNEWKWAAVPFERYGDPYTFYEYRVEVLTPNCTVWVDAVIVELVD